MHKFSKISSGGSVKGLLEEIIRQSDVGHEIGCHDTLVVLAEKSGISQDATEFLSYKFIEYDTSVFLACRTIKPLACELKGDVLRKVLLNHIPDLQQRFVMELGVYGILKDPTRRIEKEIVGQWTKRVSFSENSPQVLNS